MKAIFPRKHNFKKGVIAALLNCLFLSSFAHVAEPVLCFNQDQAHILIQDSVPAGSCRNPGGVQAPGQSTPDCSLLAERHHEQPCIDIPLASSDSSSPPQQIKKSLPERKSVRMLAASLSSLPAASKKLTFLDSTQRQSSLSLLSSLKTVVLLI